MAKKNKAEKAPAETKESKPAGPKSGLFKLMLPAMLGATSLTLILAGLLFYMTIISGAQQQVQQLSEMQAKHYVDDWVELSQTYLAVISSAAQSESVKQALLDSDQAIQDQEQEFKSFLSNATLVRIFASGKARKDPDSTPPISFAQLDMVTKTENERESALPEIHSDNGKMYLTLAAPIPGDDRIQGSVLVSFPLSSLTQQLTTLPSDQGFVEILQTFANKPQVIFSSGDAKFKSVPSYQATSQYGHWSARYYPAPSLNIVGSYTLILWVCVAVVLALILALGILSYWLISNAMLNNASILAEHIYCHTQKSESKQVFTLGIFASLANTLKNQLKDIQAKATASAAQAAAAPELKQTEEQPSSVTSSAFADDSLDVELDDDDNDLLSGAVALDDNPLDLEDMDVAEPELVSINVKVSPDIFRAYDIRGVVGDNLDPDVANAIGMAIASEARDQGQQTIVVARDGRYSSRDLAEALIDGIRSSGCNVIDIGMVPTPVLYYATKTLNTQSGVMVTGSHNPPQYNGFKVVINDETLASSRIQDLYQRIATGKLHNQGSGTYEVADITSDYQDRICSDVVLARPMRIVIDSGNGVAGPLASALLDSLGCMIIPLNIDVDGSFPNHHPDPSDPANLEQLINAVQNEEADLGIAFDGDGDRLGVVTPSGKIIWPDRLLMLFARDLLSRTPGADVLYDVKCTRDVPELVSSLGGRAIMCATGHSLMKAKMRETGAVVGGELSGHIFFNDRWYGFDDALYSAARLLEILSMEPLDTDAIFDEIPEKFSTPELHINVPDKNKFAIVEKLKTQGNFEGGNVVKIDGVRVDFPKGWGLVRASNTTPVLVARFEADTEESLEQVKTLFRDQLLAIDPGLNIPF